MIQIGATIKSIGTVQYSVPPCELCSMPYPVVSNLFFQNKYADHVSDRERQVRWVSPANNIMDLSLRKLLVLVAENSDLQFYSVPP